MSVIVRPKAIKPTKNFSFFSEHFQPFSELVDYERVFRPSYLQTLPEVVEIINRRKEEERRREEKELREYEESLKLLMDSHTGLLDSM